MSLVKDPNSIKLAMLGMVEGNGHPYSWSAIINGGYDSQTIADSEYPGILEYLSAEPPDSLGIKGASVTHVWCDKPEDSRKVVKGHCFSFHGKPNGRSEIFRLTGVPA